jgi:predicted alpha/beta-fold hydrolase
MLAVTLREQFVIGKLGERYRQRLTKMQMLSMMRATDISVRDYMIITSLSLFPTQINLPLSILLGLKTVDEHAVVIYNNYESLKHYYEDMSAMGDISEDGDPRMSRIANVAVPFCVINALDDPLITWKTVAANEGPRHPNNLVKVGAGNLVFLLTKKGGHVGWPLGWNPAKHHWKWITDAASSFVDAVIKAKRSDHDI